MKNPIRNSNNTMFYLLLRLQRTRRAEDGYTLVVTVAMLVILAALFLTAAVVSKVDSASTRSSSNSSIGFYAAEAGLNQRARAVREEFIGFERPEGTTPSDTDSDGELWDSCTTSSDLGLDDFECSTMTIQGQTVTTYVEDLTGAVPAEVPIPPDEPFGGLSAQEYRYDVISVAQDSEDLPTAILGMRFRSRLVPLFQFMAFYEQDLDVSRPPNMTLNGPVHSNSDIYFNSGAGGNDTTLAITGQVTTAGSLFRGEKFANECFDTVTIFDGTNQRALPCVNSTTVTNFAQAALSDWNGEVTVSADSLEVPEPETFEMPTDTVMTNAADREAHTYWEKADIRLVLELDNSGNPSAIQIQNIDGTVDTTATTDLNSCSVANTTLNEEASGDADYEQNDVQLRVASVSGFNVGDPIKVGDDADSNIIRSINSSTNTITLRRQLGHSYQSSTIASQGEAVIRPVMYTSDTFYNYREKGANTRVGTAGTFIRMLNVDVDALFDCIGTAGNDLMGGKDLTDETQGGLVWFLTVDGPRSHNDITDGDNPSDYGIRLYNGAAFNSTIQGMSVVSDHAVYIQGNYNSVDKKPAAVMADSINVLSNSWPQDDSYFTYSNTTNLQADGATTDFSDRDASSTTVNAAFLAGIDVTGGCSSGCTGGGIATHGGGLNNYPRFHEDWEGTTLTYLGSMITLGEARRASGEFCGSYNSGDCNIYTPPNRNWAFDEDFTDAANLPPMSPRATYLQQEIFQRSFDRASAEPLQKFASLLPKKFSNALAVLPSLQPKFIF